MRRKVNNIHLAPLLLRQTEKMVIFSQISVIILSLLIINFAA